MILIMGDGMGIISSDIWQNNRWSLRRLVGITGRAKYVTRHSLMYR
jgi:hypothetical protein